MKGKDGFPCPKDVGPRPQAGPLTGRKASEGEEELAVFIWGKLSKRGIMKKGYPSLHSQRSKA
jgi:hypothetical protein